MAGRGAHALFTGFQKTTANCACSATRLHARGGFHHDGALNDVWAVIVDLVCLGFIVWAATGLYMWWNQPRLRRWGLVALVAGFTTFLGFMFGL